MAYLVNQGLIKPKNDSVYRFWAQKVWCPNSLICMSKTVENEHFN